jgi:hypothetical protein
MMSGQTLRLDGLGEQEQGCRQWLVIGLAVLGLLTLGALVIGGLITLAGSGRRTETAGLPPQVDFSVPTAREAYVPAVNLIRQQDPLAALASGAGAWTPVISADQLNAGRTGWTFHFYLPTLGQMATVVVDRGGVAHIVEVKPWETPPDLLQDQGWQIDSPQAISQMIAGCQDMLNAQPDAQVEARLSTAASNRRLVWQVKVFSPENPLALCEVRLDATTGLPVQ